MSDSSNVSATQPGWYRDPAGSSQLRWWDGTTWTDILAADPVYAVQPRAQLAPETPIYNVFIWLIVLLPLVSAPLIWLWTPSFHFITETTGGQSFRTIDPLSMFSPGYFLILAWSPVLYGATAVFAYFDYRRLGTVGVVRPFHWAWTFLFSPVYIIGRSVIVHRVAPKRGLLPIWIFIAVIIVTCINSGIWYAQFLSTLLSQIQQSY